ncbi:MAG: TGS domain-containing protein, partial [Patescibacteria group bacterium]
YAVHPQKQKRIALETMEIYAPLAYRLGMQKLSGELEDLAFPYIYPQEHKWLVANVKDRYEEREKYAERFKPILKSEFEKNGIEILRMDSRAKRYTSLYKKLLRYDMSIENIHDLVAIRVIVNNIEDCYAALGIIHKRWPPLPGRIKDYIALPKVNGYRSLHTTVFGADDKITEIQIRTAQMHDEAELGIAAHFAYQNTKGTKDYLRRRATFADRKELAWIQQLQSWQKNFGNTEEFVQSLKIDFFKDRILVLTPKGEVIDLPAGSTPIDFAYQIHSDVGNNCSGAKVNGKIASLDYELRSGDVVEIITQQNKKPSESWLAFAKTSQAKNHIRAVLRQASTAFLSKKQPTKIEFKLVVEDKEGLLKDISVIIARSHVNIQTLNTWQNGRFPTIKINTNVIAKDKAEKLMLKLKKLKSIREISYKLI